MEMNAVLSVALFLVNWLWLLCYLLNFSQFHSFQPLIITSETTDQLLQTFPVTFSDLNLDLKVTGLLRMPLMYHVRSWRAICLR